MVYQVKLENFEGPMDLLLFFIQRDQLNIYDIPIAYITSEFLEYINLMDTMNIELGGEFVYMASLLMRIKARMLLPTSSNYDNEKIEDPRTHLVQRLLEYQQYKNASEQLMHKYSEHASRYPKGFEIVHENKSKKTGKMLKNINIFSLSGIFQELIQNLPNVNPYEVNREPLILDEQISFLLKKIETDDQIVFNSLIPHLKTRLSIVVTFMAILEMIRTKQISIKQDHPFGEITLLRS